MCCETYKYFIKYIIYIHNNYSLFHINWTQSLFNSMVIRSILLQFYCEVMCIYICMCFRPGCSKLYVVSMTWIWNQHLYYIVYENRFTKYMDWVYRMFQDIKTYLYPGKLPFPDTKRGIFFKLNFWEYCQSLQLGRIGDFIPSVNKRSFIPLTFLQI